MTRWKFSKPPVDYIPRQGGEGTAVGEICRNGGFGKATYYNWRKK